MKTPISYYGGKQTLLKHILPLIPEHSLYTEAFAGGCAVLFAKEPVPFEVILKKLIMLEIILRKSFVSVARATVENRDGASVIKGYDTAEAFHFVDPP
ncbi:MAG: DNA adenine methylase, partial [Bacteroidales bacterium]